MSEIHLPTIARIGKISREVEKARKIGSAGKVSLPTGGKTKEEQLADLPSQWATDGPFKTALASGPHLREIGPQGQICVRHDRVIIRQGSMRVPILDTRCRRELPSIPACGLTIFPTAIALYR